MKDIIVVEFGRECTSLTISTNDSSRRIAAKDLSSIKVDWRKRDEFCKVGIPNRS